MGGSAFSGILPSSAFPRLLPPVYNALKARLLPKLQALYELVGVPIEAPEKVDHGDLDILVAIPKPLHTSSVPHELVRDAIGATYMNPMEGNRTSNYAVPIRLREWTPLGCAEEEDRRRNESDDGQIYYQVDVHVCLDKNEWDRTNFFHSYGDLGMILGLISRNNGLALGAKGLKLPDPPNPPFELSDSFDNIAEFLGYSLQPFREGFQTKLDVFEWAASCRHFDASHFRSEGPGFRKVKPERTMYAEFIAWVEENRCQAQAPRIHLLSRAERQAKIREDALIFFRKKEEFEALAAGRLKRLRLKETFSGSRVRDWADMGEYWTGVKLIMDEVRKRMGGEDAILEFVNDNSEDDLREIVLQVKADLGLVSSQQFVQTQEQASLNITSTPTSTSMLVETASTSFEIE